jgi:hypothetical protein
MPLSYTVAILGRGFNWGAIISKKLRICIQQAQTSKEGETPSFYMASYYIGRHLCQKFLCRNELEMACLRTPGPCIFRHLVGEQVQEILLSHLQSIYRMYSFFFVQERVPKTVGCGQKDDIKGWPLVSR